MCWAVPSPHLCPPSSPLPAGPPGPAGAGGLKQSACPLVLAPLKCAPRRNRTLRHQTDGERWGSAGLFAAGDAALGAVLSGPICESALRGPLVAAKESGYVRTKERDKQQKAGLGLSDPRQEQRAGPEKSPVLSLCPSPPPSSVRGGGHDTAPAWTPQNLWHPLRICSDGHGHGARMASGLGHREGPCTNATSRAPGVEVSWARHC